MLAGAAETMKLFEADEPPLPHPRSAAPKHPSNKKQSWFAVLRRRPSNPSAIMPLKATSEAFESVLEMVRAVALKLWTLPLSCAFAQYAVPR